MTDLKRRLDRGLFFKPDAAAVAIAEQADREFGHAVGQVLARIQTEIHERGLSCTIRRVCDEGDHMQIIALLDHMNAHRFQILAEDLADETRMNLWQAQAKQFLRAAIGESDKGEGWPMRMNGHATLHTRPTQ